MVLQTQLQSDITQLHALAAGLCQSAGIGLQISDTEWAWNPVDRVLTVAADSLRDYGPLYCAGFVGHEVGHIFVSRYPLFKHKGPLAIEPAYNLLNALEDPRSDTWIGQRYPGVRRWLTPIRQESLGHQLSDKIPDFLKFCLECTREPSRGWLPAEKGSLPNEVAEALYKTRDARRAYIEELPSVYWQEREHDQSVVDFYHTQVLPCLRYPEEDRAQSYREMVVQCSAWRAMHLAYEIVFPAAEGLLQSDMECMASAMSAATELEQSAQALLTQMSEQMLKRLLEKLFSSLRGAAGLTPAPEHLIELAKTILFRLLQHLQSQFESSPAVDGMGINIRPGAGRWGLHRPPTDRPSTREGHASPPKSYEAVFQQVQPQIDMLVRDLNRILLPQKRLRERNGYPSGTSIDLRRLMAFDANPHDYRTLWRRKSVPNRHRTIVSLLVDLSGSMAFDKDEAALAGTVVVAETLSRLGIDFSIDGFQDELIPLCSFGTGLTEDVRRNLEGIPLEARGARPGGHNQYEFNDDGPCLAEAAVNLFDQSASDRFLIVISDGGPEGSRSQPEDLERVASELESRTDLELFGVGIGPGTEHVNKYYSQAIANVPVEQFAERLGVLIHEIVLGNPLKAIKSARGK
ncbi:MAG: hypothetical protein ABW139_06545 [Candidatus Thiodiazotropha sp. DIVDIV]